MNPRRLSPLFPILAAFAAAPASPAAQPKIGVLLKGRSDFWSAVEAGAREAGAKLGAEVIVKAPPSETDVAVQIRLLQSLAAQGVQAVVIAPCSKDSLAGPVAALAKKGVKIVVVDSPLAGPAAKVFVGTDQTAAGQAAGTLLASLVGDGDEVCLFRHDQSGGATLERETGVQEKLCAAHPGVVLHGDIYGSTEDGAQVQRAQMLLSKYPGTKAIFASGTPETMAMLQVLEERKSGGKVAFIGCGFNLNPAVVQALSSGAMAGWIAQLPEEVGYKGVASALDLIAGKDVSPIVATDFVVITKDNLREPRVQALLGK